MIMIVWAPSFVASHLSLVFGLWSSIFGLRSSVFGLRSSIFGLRSSVFSLRSSVFGLQSSIFGLRSLVFGLLLLSSSVWSQDYRFHVTEMKLQAYILPDASARLVYDITFANQPGAHAIDIVDIGLPHRDYDIGNMSASIDGQTISGINRSTYVAIGVEVHLGSEAIPPGGTGTLHFECTMPDMVYGDTTDAEYASFQIVPTWFDPELQTGSTSLQAAVHLLPDVKAEDVRYQDQRQRYSNLVMYGDGQEKHVVAIWTFPQINLSSQNPKLALSFSKQGMQRVIEQSMIDLLIKWFDERPTVKIWSGISLVVLLGISFFRFSHGTGLVLFLLLAGGFVFLIITSTGWHLASWPVVLSIFGGNELYLRKRKYKSYLPAMATVEGGGIKRGLTAPQAAVLLELPLGKVVSMVIFGLLKKGVLTQVREEPLTVEVCAPFRLEKAEIRRRHAGKEGIVLHDYEHPFIDALRGHAGPVEECNLSQAMGKLITSTSNRMKGFDLEQTREYYRRIVARAWTEAKSIGEVEQRTEAVDRNFEWMMMDPQWTVIFDSWGRGGYDYRPVWHRRLPRPTSGGGTGHLGGGGGTSGKPAPRRLAKQAWGT